VPKKPRIAEYELSVDRVIEPGLVGREGKITILVGTGSARLRLMRTRLLVSGGNARPQQRRWAQVRVRTAVTIRSPTRRSQSSWSSSVARPPLGTACLAIM
jgi:hypothetical protein